MPITIAFHTNSPRYSAGQRSVHHYHTACAQGQGIELRHRRLGEGGRPACRECERLERERG